MSSDLLYDTGIKVPDVLTSGAVTASVLEEKVRLSLRVKPKDRTAVAKALGLALPSKIGASSIKGGLMAACLGPEEWIVVAEKQKYSGLYDKALKLSESFIMSVTDVSHRNVGITLLGSAAAETVNVGCPLDMGLDYFPVGKCTRTVFESSPILLYRNTEDSFTIECWRSFAPYVLGLMTAHAKAIKA